MPATTVVSAAASTTTVVIRIDDCKREQVVYKPAEDWYGLSDSKFAFAFNNTVSVSEKAGTSASLTFIGTKVGVFGTFERRGNISMSTEYILDSYVAVTFASDSRTSTGTSTTPDSIQFYESPTLQYGEHTITMINMQDSSVMLDYFEITTNQDSNTSRNTSTSKRVNSTPDSDSNSNSGSGALIGTFLGGLVLGLLLAAFVYLAASKKRRSTRAKEASGGGASSLVRQGYGGTVAVVTFPNDPDSPSYGYIEQMGDKQVL